MHIISAHVLRNCLRGLMVLGVLLVVLAPLLLPGGGWLALVVAAAVGSAYLLSCKRFTAVGLSLRGFGAVPLLLALAALLAAIWQGQDALHSGLPLWLAAGLLAMASVALGAINISAAYTFGAFALTGVATGSWAAWQNMALGANRAAGFAPLNAILYGNLSLVVGLICLAGLAWAWQCPNRHRWLLLCGLGALGGLAASLLSGTRGGWVALPLAGLLFYRVYLKGWSRGWHMLVLASIATLALSLYALPQTGVEQRVDKAIEEGQDYLEGEAHGSVGVRLELYRVSLSLIAQRPLRGYSLEEYQQAMQAKLAAGEISASVARHWHVHNDVLNAWVRYGLLGVLATLLLYVWPFAYFASRLPYAKPDQRPIVLAGMLLPVLFFDFGLTYAFFAYPVVLATYWIWLLLLVSSYLSATPEGSR